jgi:hypothetical protein
VIVVADELIGMLGSVKRCLFEARHELMELVSGPDVDVNRVLGDAVSYISAAVAALDRASHYRESIIAEESLAVLADAVRDGVSEAGVMAS